MPKRVSVKGKGADLFFGDYDPVDAPAQPGARVSENGQLPEQSPEVAPAVAALTPLERQPTAAKTAVKPSRAKPTSQRANSVSSEQANLRDRALASMLAGVQSETIDAIRKVVKTQGREVSFIRLTPEEKAQVSDIVYTYKRQGQKTTENQINRIAINYLLHDYHEQGEHSVLARVLASLLA